MTSQTSCLRPGATHGGVFIPMYQSEALWINFSGDYPCAVKIAAGKINAVSGKSWSNGLSDDPQDYAVIPEQPWLDGFNVSEDFIRQFVAMPLGEGFTAEEQITGKAEHGGLQIIVYPMKHDVYVEHFERAVEADLDYLDMPMFCRESANQPPQIWAWLPVASCVRRSMKMSMASTHGTRTTATDASFTWQTVRNTRRSPGTSHPINRRLPRITRVPDCLGSTTTMTARRYLALIH